MCNLRLVPQNRLLSIYKYIIRSRFFFLARFDFIHMTRSIAERKTLGAFCRDINPNTISLTPFLFLFLLFCLVPLSRFHYSIVVFVVVLNGMSMLTSVEIMYYVCTKEALKKQPRDSFRSCSFGRSACIWYVRNRASLSRPLIVHTACVLAHLRNSISDPRLSIYVHILLWMYFLIRRGSIICSFSPCSCYSSCICM